MGKLLMIIEWQAGVKMDENILIRQRYRNRLKEKYSIIKHALKTKKSVRVKFWFKLQSFWGRALLYTKGELKKACILYSYLYFTTLII